MTRHSLLPITKQAGQSSMEYLVVCGALALALGIGMTNDQSVLWQLLDAFRAAFHNFSYSLSLPG